MRKPSSTTTPEPSVPGTTKRSRPSGRIEGSQLPTPAVSTAIRTSRRPTLGTGTSRIETLPRRSIVTARMDSRGLHDVCRRDPPAGCAYLEIMRPTGGDDGDQTNHTPQLVGQEALRRAGQLRKVQGHPDLQARAGSGHQAQEQGG